MPDILRKLDLDFNPFEPSASGPPIGTLLSLPSTLKQQILSLLDSLKTARGAKVIVVVGHYGTGKTCLLRWLHDTVLPERRIRTFYFDNPGVHFYDLANTLLRTIGRKDFAKFIWELAGPYVSTPYQRSLFQRSFEEYLSAENRPRRGHQQDVAGPLQRAIMETGVTSDEEIAHCLARIVTDAVRKPYFEYRDFLPGRSDSLVAEAEEARYFDAILRTLARGSGADAVAFLIDEFEEIGLQKRLTKRAAHDYLATLKRLINLARNEDAHFWLFLSMTPDAYETTRELEPALVERYAPGGSIVRVPPLKLGEAATLAQARLDKARPSESASRIGSLFPFPEDIPFSHNTLSNPRRLVKACSSAISRATLATNLPFSTNYLQEVERSLFPIGAVDKDHG